MGAINRSILSPDGAAYVVWESSSEKPTSSVIRRKGRRGRRPLRWVRVGRFQRSREVQFPAPATLYAASSVTLLLVGCTVLGAPRSRDRRGGLDADVRPDRFYPRYPRCVNRALTDQRFIFRGHSPRTISYGRPTLSVHQRRAGVEARPYGEWVALVDG